MATNLNIEEITQRANEAHERRLAALQRLVDRARDVEDAKAVLADAQSASDSAFTEATDAGWSAAELAGFGLTVPSTTATVKRPRKPRTTRANGRAVARPMGEGAATVDTSSVAPEPEYQA